MCTDAGFKPPELPLAETIQLTPTTASHNANHRKVPKRLADFLEKAEAAHLVTDSAVQSVLNLVDPFPDEATEAVGWPGMCSQNTLPMIMTDYADISAPAGVTTTWNYKVLFLPFSNPFPSNTTTTWDRTTGTTTATVANAATYGQFNIWTWKAEDPEPNIIDVAPTKIMYLDPQSTWSHIRIVSAGFEAINTSAELYRGGMYYGFRTPLMTDEDFVAYAGTAGQTVNNTYSRLFLMAGLPNALADVINLNTTVSAAARHGVGVFSLPMSIENPFTTTLPTNILLLDDISSGQMVKARIPPVNLSSPYKWMPCGAYVTGLAAQATFQLKVRVGYELMPGADASRTYQSLSHKPVQRSFLIEEMLYGLLSNTPAAFDYSENPLGEWMGKILQGLAAVIPTVAGFIPHPAAKIIGGIAGPALSSVGRVLEGKPSDKKKTKINKTAPPPLPPRKKR